jgi:hypothetical protein
MRSRAQRFRGARAGNLPDEHVGFSSTLGLESSHTGNKNGLERRSKPFTPAPPCNPAGWASLEWVHFQTRVLVLQGVE